MTSLVIETSYLDFSNMSPFEESHVLAAIFDCIKCASDYCGKVFGGFVRDVIVPRLNDRNCRIKFKDVDLWFDSHKDASKFIMRMGNKLIKSDVKFTNGLYPDECTRQQFNLINNDTIVAWIDIIVSPKLPVNDFDVNTVTYWLNNYSVWKTNSPDYLITQIINKEASMLLTYKQLIDNAPDISNDLQPKSFYHNRINRIFTSKGWKVYIPLDSSK